MTEMGNLDTCTMVEVGNLLGEITDPMAIIIRVVRLMARCFLFL